MFPKAFSLFILLLSLCFAAAGCSGDQSSGERASRGSGGMSLKLDGRHGIRFLGFYVAQERGFFAEEGLEISIYDTAETVEADTIPIRTAAGEFDFAVGSAPLVEAQRAGLPVVVLSSIYQFGGDASGGKVDPGTGAPAGLAEGQGYSLYTRREHLGSRGDSVGRFVGASLKGWRWAVEHPEDAVDDMLSSFPELVAQRERWQKSFRASIPLVMPSGTFVGELDCAAWEERVNLPSPASGTVLCDSSFLQQQAPSFKGMEVQRR